VQDNLAALAARCAAGWFPVLQPHPLRTSPSTDRGGEGPGDQIDRPLVALSGYAQRRIKAQSRLTRCAGSMVCNCLSGSAGADGQIADTQLDHIGKDTIVLAGKAYVADRIRAFLRERGAMANIPANSNGRWKPYFSTWLYRERNLVELLIEAEALPSHRHSLRQTGREFPRHCPARLKAPVTARL